MSYQYDQATALPYRNFEGKEIKPPPHLDEQFLVQNKLPVYVLYNIDVNAPSTLTLTLKMGAGDSRPLKIPKSKRPFDVTSEISIEDLRRAGRELWTAVKRGGLLLVWPSDAEKLGGGSNASKQVPMSEWSASNTTKSPRVKAMQEIAVQTAQAKIELETPEEEASEPVNPRVMGIEARFAAGELKVEAAIEEYEQILDGCTERDLGYAIAQTKPGKLRDWLQAQAASRVGAPAAKKTTSVDPTKKAGWDDDDSDMTEEEKAAEAKRAAAARAKQKLQG